MLLLLMRCCNTDVWRCGAVDKIPVPLGRSVNRIFSDRYLGGALRASSMSAHTNTK